MITELLYSLNNYLYYILRLNPKIALLLVSIVTVLISTLVYKRFSNQKEIKRLKTLVKDMNKDAKAHMDNKEKVLEIQNDILKYNMDLMKLTMRPSFYTIIPLMMIFIWLSLVFAQQPIMPGAEFNVFVPEYNNIDLTSEKVIESYANFEFVNQSQTNEGLNFIFKAPSTTGKYNYKVDESSHSIIVSNYPVYFERKINTESEELEINTGKLIILNLFGWRLGYLGTYIIFSIFINTIIRKLLNVH